MNKNTTGTRYYADPIKIEKTKIIFWKDIDSKESEDELEAIVEDFKSKIRIITEGEHRLSQNYTLMIPIDKRISVIPCMFVKNREDIE